MSKFSLSCLRLLLLLTILGASSLNAWPRWSSNPPVPEEKTAQVVSAATAGNLVENGSFEQNGGVDSSLFSGWTVFDQGAGSWFAQTGTTPPFAQKCSNAATSVSSPTDGAFAAMAAAGNPGTHVLYQDVFIQPGAILSFDLYLNNRAGSFVIPPSNTLDFSTGETNQHFRVDIMNPLAPIQDTGAGVLRNVYITQPSDPTTSGYTRITESLDLFAGQVIRLRFAEVDNQSCLLVGIDDVQISGTASPFLPTVSFVASPSTIRIGQSSTLLFSTQNAVSVTIDNGVTVSGTSGSVTVSPGQTTTYTLTATGSDGSKRIGQVTVTVVISPAVTVSVFPQGMFQLPGTAGATDLIIFTNVGGSAATISLVPAGNFFTIAPTSLIIAPGGSETVTITANAQPAGTFDGSVAVSGAGIQGALTIPVRLLVSAPPTVSVIPAPATNRVDVTQPNGSLPISNTGADTLQGILLSDAPWLIPQGGIVTIPAGQTITVTFTIDRSKRPDGDNPIGAVTGFLTLMYLDTPQGSQLRAIEALADGAPTSSTKIVVVDTAAPATMMTPLPPLVPGEIAVFLLGLARRTSLVSDVRLSNPSQILGLNSLQLFFATSGLPTALVPRANLPTIGPAGRALFSDVVQGVFNRPEGEVGSAQLRGSNVSGVTLAGVVTNPTNPSGLFSGAVASLRSDRSAGANEQIILTGIRSDSGTRTDLYVQEAAGFAGSVRTDFLGEDGVVRRSRTDPIGAFALVEIANEAPAGAVTATVTNLGTGSRIVAHALVFDVGTGDATNLVDWNRRNATAASEPQIIPLAQTGATQGRRLRTDLAIANPGTVSASGVLTLYGSPRRRIVSRGSGSASLQRISPMEVSRTITVEPGKTQILGDVVASLFGAGTTSGYLLYTPASGTVAIAGRTYSHSATAQPGGPGTSGTGVPVVASSLGLKLGETRQFTHLEDAAASTVATAERATYRTGFGLIESSGNVVTVRATLRYQTTVPGGLANAPLSASKTFALTSRGMLIVSDLARTLFGSGRDALGDLHDLVLEVAVTQGEGRVIPYVLATENGSGDTILRIE